MPIQKTEKIWHNGKWINWDDATLHVLSHVVSYGSAVFEGIRCYETKQGPAIFRLREHMQRLINSAKNLSHGLALLRRSFLQRRDRTGAPQQTELLLRQAHRSARLRRSRRQSAQFSDRSLHGLLVVGRLSRSGCTHQGRRRRRQLLDAHRAQHAARDVQSRRQLHEFATHPHGSLRSTATPKASRSIPAATSAKAPA